MIEQRAFELFIGAQFGPYRIKQLVEVQYHAPLFLAQKEESSALYFVRLLTGPASLQSSKRDDYLATFEHKASQLAALRHPCLLPVIDYGVQHNIPFLVMPQVAMQPLRVWLAENGSMDALMAARYLDQLCGMLAYAHQHDILHESLSVDCIYLRQDGQLLVANLGLISLLEMQHEGSQPNPGIIVGEGSAPEQLTGKPVGPFTDIYALGAVLYHLLTGSPAFSGSTPQELTRQHLHASIPPLNRRSDLPSGLYSVFARAMAKTPELRFQQAGALAHAYHRVANPDARNRVPFAIISSPAEQLPFTAEMRQAQGQLAEHEPDTDKPVIVQSDHSLQLPQPALSSMLEDAEDLSNTPTLKRVPALPRQTALPLTPEDVGDKTTLPAVSAPRIETALPPTLPDLPDTDFQNPSSDRQVALPQQLPRKHSWRNARIALLLVLVSGGIIGAVLFSRQNAALAELIGKVGFSGNANILLGVCIVLAIAFTVGFNIISRISLSTTKHEYAYTILWQLFCALLVPFFLPFDRFSINASPRVLLLFALSIVLWALVDAFLFSSFKYEEASVLSAIFPLNYVFTFVASVLFFHSVINSTIVIGFLIIMAASMVIGLRYMRVRPSKGIIFALLYSLFQGVALGFNSAVVKSFSIPPYMFAAFLFPAIANLFIFLRPKVAELRHELRVQWKKILLNAAVMDLSFFFLLKAFELGNVPQVVALSASSTLLTALAGIVILKEDSHIALKILAAALATLGIILVQF